MDITPIFQSRIETILLRMRDYDKELEILSTPETKTEINNLFNKLYDSFPENLRTLYTALENAVFSYLYENAVPPTFSFQAPIYKDNQKTAYYELMTFAKDFENPLCNPDCPVRIMYGTTVGYTLTAESAFLKLEVSFTVPIPETVLEALNKKGLVEKTTETNIAIVCRPKEDEIPF